MLFRVFFLSTAVLVFLQVLSDVYTPFHTFSNVARTPLSADIFIYNVLSQLIISLAHTPKAFTFNSGTAFKFQVLLHKL